MQRRLAWQSNVNPHSARYAELEEQRLAWCQNLPADRNVVFEGAAYQMPVSGVEAGAQAQGNGLGGVQSPSRQGLSKAHLTGLRSKSGTPPGIRIAEKYDVHDEIH